MNSREYTELDHCNDVINNLNALVRQIEQKERVQIGELFIVDSHFGYDLCRTCGNNTEYNILASGFDFDQLCDILQFFIELLRQSVMKAVTIEQKRLKKEQREFFEERSQVAKQVRDWSFQVERLESRERKLKNYLKKHFSLMDVEPKRKTYEILPVKKHE